MATKTKGKTVKVEEIENISDIEAVKAERKIEQGETEVRILVNICANYGTFRKGEVVKISAELAERLIGAKRAEKCS